MNNAKHPKYLLKNSDVFHSEASLNPMFLDV